MNSKNHLGEGEDKEKGKAKSGQWRGDHLFAIYVLLFNSVLCERAGMLGMVIIYVKTTKESINSGPAFIVHYEAWNG